MIDVHVLTLPTDRKDWFDLCIASLKDEPINLHILDGIQDKIGQARVNGFAQGSSDFVSYVDPDDYVLPGGFARCEEALTQHSSVACAYTFEYRTGINGTIRSYNSYHHGKHHLVVFRRSFLENYYERLKEQNILPEVWLLKQIEKNFKHKAFFEIAEPFYVWRIHDQSWTQRERIKVSKESRLLREST